MRIALTLCLAMVVASLGCKSVNDLRTGGPAEGYVSSATLEPQIEVENRTINGEATITKILFFEFGDTEYADGVVFGTSTPTRKSGAEVILGLLTFGLIGGGDDAGKDKAAKEAAALKACQSAGADIIVDPRYRVEKFAIPFFYSRVNASVRGRPAKITGYRQIKMEDLVPKA